MREVLNMIDAQGSRLTVQRKKRCAELFTRSARYEYMFWDMAWTEQRWLP